MRHSDASDIFSKTIKERTRCNAGKCPQIIQ